MEEKTTSENMGAEGAGRRQFLKTSLSAVLGAIGAATAEGFTARDVMARTHEEFPVPLSDDFAPLHQRNLVLTRAYGKLDPHLANLAFTKYKKQPPKPVPGYSQLDFALAVGGWAIMKHVAPFDSGGFGDHGIVSWDRYDYKKYETRHEFASRTAASAAIKKAAEIYGAILCGVARRDPRWDYAGFYDAKTKTDYGWEKFPFKPKSVIVMAVPMDYHSITASPAWTASGTVGTGYSRMILTAAAMAQFIRGLGYNAIPAGNSLGNSVAYGILAGLGEGGRAGGIIVPKHGPRVRLCKVYTDFDFVEYDKPMTFGVASFCERCKRCADACPAGAISKDDKPSFGPTYTDDPEKSWNNQKGVLKYYSDSKKCFEFWAENGTECNNCIAACPYNKPDFWHHRLVDYMNTVVPGPLHSFMREMDIAFGYGSVSNPDAVKKFWSTMEG